MKKVIILTLVVCSSIFCSGQCVSITITSVQQRTDGTGLVDVYFNLSGPANVHNIDMQASFDGGSTFSMIPPAYIEGAVTMVSPGSNKHIVWNGLANFPNTFSTQARLELTATEEIYGIPCPGMPTVTDIDGNIYNTVLIGNQCWMAENLRVTRDASGNNITRYCYGNNTANCELYGGLYTWHTLMNGQSSSSSNPSGVQGICPPGWRVPSHHEWTQLEQYICNKLGNSNCATQFPYHHSTWGWRGTNEGNALKSCRQVGSPWEGCNTSEHPRWYSHSTHYGFDEFVFSALPGGYRYTNGVFGGLGLRGLWWASTESSSTRAWLRHMGCSSGGVDRNKSNKANGFSVRCVRDLQRLLRPGLGAH